MGLSYILCIYVIVVGVLAGLLTVGVEGVSHSLASSWNTFPPFGMLHPSLIQVFVPGLIVTYYALLC